MNATKKAPPKKRWQVEPLFIDLYLKAGQKLNKYHFIENCNLLDQPSDQNVRILSKGHRVMLWQITVSPYALAASATLTFDLTVSKRFIVHFLLQNYLDFSSWFLMRRKCVSSKIRRFRDLAEAEETQIAKMQSSPDYWTGGDAE